MDKCTGQFEVLWLFLYEFCGDEVVWNENNLSVLGLFALFNKLRCFVLLASKYSIRMNANISVTLKIPHKLERCSQIS